MKLRRLFWILPAVLFPASCGGDDGLAQAGLAQALEGMPTPDAVVAQTFVGQEVNAPLFGMVSSTTIDPNQPTVRFESQGDNRHVVVNMSSLLASLPNVPQNIVLELWVTDGRIVIDSRSFDAITEMNPAADFGPMNPGLAFINSRESGVSAESLVQAIAGAPLPNFSEISDTLPLIFSNLERQGGTNTSFTGIANFAEYQSVMGQNIEDYARSSAAGMALNLNTDVDALVDIYVDFFRGIETNVTITFNTSGELSSIYAATDMSGLYAHIIQPKHAAALKLSSDDLSSFLEVYSEDLANAVFVVESSTEFEFPSSADFSPPPETSEDRTNAWVEFLISNGLL